MANLWRDSVHGAIYGSGVDQPGDADRATALLVGVEPTRAIALVRLLAPLARTRLAPDLPHALEMSRALQPDLIVTGADSVDDDVSVTLRALNADPMLEDIPVIVLASNDDDGTRSSAMRGGALAWLPHTADADAVLARVRLAVRMRRNALARSLGSAAAARR
jgi:DNA-binding response OmpR family regulator